MAQRRPLFAGDSEIDQIFKIFQIMGTPNDATWGGVNSLPDFKSSFPKWKPVVLSRLATNLDEKGVDLFEKMIQLDPSKRISAREALDHVIFIFNYLIYPIF